MRRESGETMKSNMWKWMFGLMAAMLVFVTGCQAVGGLDLNKIWTSSVETTSSEGSASFSLEMKLDPSELKKMDNEEQAVFRMLNGMKVNMSDIKVQDQNNMSLKGTVQIAKGSIPFHAVLSDQVLTIQAEGVDKPFQLDLNHDDSMDPAFRPQLQELQNKLKEQGGELQKQLIGFIASHLPNPQKISVESVTDSIYGEQVKLHKVHAEIYASELLDLVKKFLTDVAADDEGLKALLGYFYDAFQPLLAERMEQSAAPSAGDMSFLLKDKETAVNMIHSVVKEELNKAIAEFDQEAADIDKTMLTDDNYLKVDLYVDDDFHTRKSSMELQIAPREDGITPVQIKVTATSEVWNINKPVAIDRLAGETFVLSEQTKAKQVLDNVDPKSLLYDVLKNDLKITRKTVTLYIIGDQVFAPGSFARPYMKGEGTTMVPERFLTERLDLRVYRDENKQQLMVQDPATGKEVGFVIGSNTAYVNGSPVQLEEAPDRVDESDFVPLRFIVEQLGGEVKWDATGGKITIIKED